ncbi:hypothetical protein FOMPIDRAFT_114781 [Fomitopsis schrenkii]|uniref:DUF6533 domain-containing protein n=1 Tax=Fomitopsis schrenkii TaxID=2126942 RepID=S8EBP3_FOMSC|nr:hypothetical protein FOMPIDRAFT_114781 [Fomitopsis schrenkii]
MSGITTAQMNALIDQAFLANALCIVGLVIYLYDRCLTFKGEVETIWRGSSISIATALYVLLHLSEVLSQCCAVAFNFITGCELATFVVGAVFSVSKGGFTGLRAYAISGRSMTLLIAQASTLYENSTEPGIGCVIAVGIDTKINRYNSRVNPSGVIVTGGLCNLVSEALLIAATWHRCAPLTVKASGGRFGTESQFKSKLSVVIFRAGAVYFVVIPALSVVTTALSFIEVAYYSSLVDGIATACVCINLGSKKFGHDTLHSLQVNLLSHFFMNLRDANTDATGGTLHASQMTDPRFNRVVGNLAGSISYDADSEADEDDAEGTDMENDSGSGDGPERGEVTEASGDTTSRHNDVL